MPKGQRHANGVLTTGQIARLCCVCPYVVSQWVDSGRLKGYRVAYGRGQTAGRLQQRRVRRPDLVQFLREQNMPVPPELIGSDATLLCTADEQLCKSLTAGLGTGLLRVRNLFDLGAQCERDRPGRVILDLGYVGIEAGLEAARAAQALLGGVRLVLVLGEDQQRDAWPWPSYRRPFDVRTLVDALTGE